ncbi:double-stranded RNA-specific editase B2-like [Coccinella septempunctata]|uniref:double-stranded RNA-specific editase B2-like n=1 Tax=Coccinella septempunctata TaxID=41139 RepID=UPI001D07931D|nr:double-stranded RNA-specific editase B2-like [Coccinella septempunctata]
MHRNTPRGRGANQNSTRRSGGTNFVPGGQIFQRRQDIIAAETRAPTQQAPTPVTPVTAQPKPPVKPIEQEPVNQPMDQQPEKVDVVEEDTKKDAEKKSWMNRKIPKKEKLRRRNQRLSKLLQPKNALMILHELVKNPIFNVSENDGQFQAEVTVAGTQHVGLGKNKNAAKNAASEAALRHLIKYKTVLPMEASSDDSSVKMDTSSSDPDESTEDMPLPWQQVASFALYKLFDSWGENVNKKEEPKKINSARKLPENAATINPVMIINQMYPLASFDEVEQVGNPPNIVFTIQCNVDGQSFKGTGSSKKAAKKLAAYAACHTLLGIVYPPEQYTPSE